MTPPGKIPFPQFDIDTVNTLIQQRRSLFPRDFSGEPVSKEEVSQILENAHWASTHGKTEPWSPVPQAPNSVHSVQKGQSSLPYYI